jgi:phenylalanyl-tRNA synthetase beta subunit
VLAYGASGIMYDDIANTLGVDVIKEEIERIFKKSGHNVNLSVDLITASDVPAGKKYCLKRILRLSAPKKWRQELRHNRLNIWDPCWK